LTGQSAGQRALTVSWRSRKKIAPLSEKSARGAKRRDLSSRGMIDIHFMPRICINIKECGPFERERGNRIKAFAHQTQFLFRHTTFRGGARASDFPTRGEKNSAPRAMSCKSSKTNKKITHTARRLLSCSLSMIFK
jgi:hypothetical protein